MKNPDSNRTEIMMVKSYRTGEIMARWKRSQMITISFDFACYLGPRRHVSFRKTRLCALQHADIMSWSERDKITTRHQTNVHVLTHLPSKSRRPKWHLANFMARSYPNQLAAPQKGPSLANVMSTLGTQDCRANEPELRLLGNDQSWDRSFNGHLNPRTVEAQKDQNF